MIIHKKAKIGKNCVISQNVTIGSKGPLPIIGDNVYIAPGSKCIGGQIGNNVVIGANSVVTKEIPDNCVVAGVPAKIVSTDMEKYQNYFRK
ncbi:Serine acetyltransferase [Chlamydia trachomatis]|nr:Serine acetyltransferase [Chlamydia trachomatis]